LLDFEIGTQFEVKGLYLLSGDKKIARLGLYQNFQMPKVEVGQKNLSKHGWIDRSNQQ
jgi:hypothetical protein